MSKKRRRSNNRPNKNQKETYIEKVAKAAEEADEQLQEALKAEKVQSAEEAGDFEETGKNVKSGETKANGRSSGNAGSSKSPDSKNKPVDKTSSRKKEPSKTDEVEDNIDDETDDKGAVESDSGKNKGTSKEDTSKDDIDAGNDDSDQNDDSDHEEESDQDDDLDNTEDSDRDKSDGRTSREGSDGSASKEGSDGSASREGSDGRTSKEGSEGRTSKEGSDSSASQDDDDEPTEEEEAQNKEFSDASAKLKEDYDFEDSPEYRKIMRHKRRVRNQVIAYIVTFLLLAGIGIGVYFGAQYLTKIIKADQAKKAEEKAAEEAAAAAEEAQKQEIVVTAPETVEEEDNSYEEEIVEMTPEDYLNEMVTSTITQMPLEDKVAQLFVITPEALTGVGAATKAGDGTKEALSKYAVGGLIYDKRNIEDEDQFVELIDNTRNMSKYDLFIGVKEPGGDSSTLAGSKLGDVPPVDSPSAVAQTGDPTNAYNAGVTISSYLSYYGINLDLAPNASITTDEKSISASSSYGADEAVAYEMISKMIEGLQTGSVRACLTDFPGTGNITEDTASGRVESEITSDDISAQIAPYITGVMAGAQFIQVNNVTYMTIDEDAMPASMSKNIVDTYLRGNMGYDGVVISGPLNEKAVTEYYTSDQAALYAYAAGVDLIYMPEDFEMAYNAVLDAVKDGTIPESRIDKSLERIFKVKLAGYVE